MTKIAIQGGAASFHHQAAWRYLGDEPDALICCETFREVCTRLVSGEADLGVMAIENSLAGGILSNYGLLAEYPLHILEETWLEIEQHLIGLPEASMDGLQTVSSHPMALLQCSRFLDQRPALRRVETWDTADSVRRVAERNDPTRAAIAGRMAAQRYGLEILAESIQDFKHNYTRFLVLSRQPNEDHAPDKASLNFSLRHQSGALAEALHLFSRNHMNLTQIQSVPIPEQPREYTFHVDLEWQDEGVFRDTLGQLSHLSHQLKLLGTYKRGVRPDDHTTLATA